MCACLTLALLLSAPQPAAAQPAVVDELKAIRATLEKVETSQRMLLALIRIQIDEARLSPLERERQTLTAQEGALRDELDALQATLKGAPHTSSLAVSDATGADGLNDTQAGRGRVDELVDRVERGAVCLGLTGHQR